ncbi:AAA family ATPase [Nocardioides sp.]|uniref:AAA family ATPase n=1 Tax=Nocardioides sp. TaxID=35761 RepID=UPI002C70EB96|nr:AAA family ATPase [Nocardioides sp.]HSX65922.1 AAA family ATPase [Nocardioides sp.]
MRLSAEAMNAALADLQALQYQTQVASAYEAFLASKWVQVNEGGALPSFSNIKRAVPAVFGVLPGNELGRLAPFRYDWLTLQDTGRKTVWNNNSRGGTKVSLTLFVNNDIRGGLQANAAATLGALLPADRPSWQSLAVLVLREHDFAASDDWPVAQTELLSALGLTATELGAITTNTPLGVPLLSATEWSFDTIDEALRPSEAVVVQTPAAAAPAGGPTAPEEGTLSVIVDSRVERMLRLAITAYSSVLLVGPPGTGKGTLLRWMLADMAAKPEKYGFEAGYTPDPLWRTPDESWTSFELIGGLAPNENGVLTWSPGALLNAIDEDRWLILDETNRGDMDKIMGPLLTWLSKQDVEIGRSAAHDGKPIKIGWASDRPSTVEDDADGTDYKAGRDWRLLGTYNPQDAQRVFRFGQALSRRFVIVPIPAVRPGQFSQLLEDAYPNLSADAMAAIGGLYSAHLADEVTALGPALFLGMARYVLTELGPAAGADDQAQAESNGDDEQEAPAEEGSILLGELLAEAYVMGAGRYLAGFDDRVFEALGERIVNDETALTTGQWSWVKTQRDVLS